MIDRDTATERLRAAKVDADVSFAELSTAVERDEVWTAALLLGAVSGTEAEAEALCDALDVADQDVVAALQRAPYKGERANDSLGSTAVPALRGPSGVRRRDQSLRPRGVR